MATRTYKGYRIVAHPYQLHESQRWTADLEIRRRGRSQPIMLDERCGSAQEAERYCATVARLIIDGGMPGWSVEGLRGPDGPRDWFTHSFKDVLMRPLVIAGIVVAVLGLFVLLRGASFTTQEDVVSLGDVSLTAESRETIPPWVGGGALVAGVAMVVVGLRRRS